MPDHPDRVTLDVFLVTLLVPCDLTDAAVVAARREIDRKSFRRRLRAVVRRLLRRSPALAAVAVAVTR